MSSSKASKGNTLAKCTDEVFKDLLKRHGPTRTAKILECDVRNVFYRKKRMQEREGIKLEIPYTSLCQQSDYQRLNYPGRVHVEIENGLVLVGSDFHIWPGEQSVCMRAFKKFAGEIKPKACILNGDVMDFTTISRHPQNWENAPDVIQEIEAAQDHLNDIEQALPKGCLKFWTLGNHDARFEMLFANHVRQMKGVKGVHLADHFALWQKAMSVMINEGVPGGWTIVKHRGKGGKHAAKNNVESAGIHMITGHLHSAKVSPHTDYNRFDRYGVDCGMVQSKNHRAFAYTEDSASDWREAFGLLTYVGKRLMYPELVSRWDDDHVQFRGQLIKV